MICMACICGSIQCTYMYDAVFVFILYNLNSPIYKVCTTYENSYCDLFSMNISTYNVHFKFYIVYDCTCRQAY